MHVYRSQSCNSLVVRGGGSSMPDYPPPRTHHAPIHTATLSHLYRRKITAPSPTAMATTTTTAATTMPAITPVCGPEPAAKPPVLTVYKYGW